MKDLDLEAAQRSSVALDAIGVDGRADGARLLSLPPADQEIASSKAVEVAGPGRKDGVDDRCGGGLGVIDAVVSSARRSSGAQPGRRPKMKKRARENARTPKRSEGQGVVGSIDRINMEPRSTESESRLQLPSAPSRSF